MPSWTGRHLDRVDENAADAYATKSSRYGRTYVPPMIAPARDTTLRQIAA